MSDISAQAGQKALGVSQLNVSPRHTEVGTVENGDHKEATSVAPGKELPQQTPEQESVAITEAVDKLNNYVQSIQRTLDFQLDEASGKTIIKVFDKESEELIRQIPGELAVELAQKLNEEEPLLLFSAQV